MRIFVLLLFLLPGLAHAETRAAFVVGNSAYENAPRLANPVRDARLVGDTLVSLGFDVTRHTDLTRDEFADALSDFLRNSRDADVTFFYFAGHGMQYDGENYLIGTNAELRSELDIDGEAIALDKVVELLERNSKAALVFVDACRDNPLATDFYRRNFSETRALQTRGLARMRSRADGAMVVFAAAPGEVAYDGAGTNSPFALSLARHLPTANTEVLSLTKRIIRDVRDETEGRQSPIVTNDLTTEVFLRVAALPPETGAQSDVVDQEQAFFDAAEKIDTLHAWALYFERYPSGRLSSLALQREHEALLREVSHLASEWTYETPDVAMTNALAARLETRIGLGRTDAIAAQALLNRVGFDAGPLDGALGAKSRAAIRAFQEANDLPPTGMLTRATAAALGLQLEQYSSRPGFSSHRMRRLDLEAARLLGVQEELLQFFEEHRVTQAVYGYFNNRIYVVSNVLADFSFFYDFVSKDTAPVATENHYIAHIESDAENRFVYELSRYDQTFWWASSNRDSYFGPRIGLFQLPSSREPSRDWYWQSGRSGSYRAWGNSEPNNFNGNEDYVQLVVPFSAQNGTPDLPRGARWNDMPFGRASNVFEIELEERQ